MRTASRRLMYSLGLVLAAMTIYAAAAQASPPAPQRQRDCLHLPRTWHCLDVQRRGRADAFHAVVPVIRHRAFAPPRAVRVGAR